MTALYCFPVVHISISLSHRSLKMTQMGSGSISAIDAYIETRGDEIEKQFPSFQNGSRKGKESPHLL